jgi:hypothetical protein
MQDTPIEAMSAVNVEEFEVLTWLPFLPLLGSLSAEELILP